MKQDTYTDELIRDAGHDEDTIPQVRALCSHLECLPEELSLKRHDHYGLAVYSYGRREFAIGDDGEADEAVRDSIKDCVWSFRPEFLASYTGLPEVVFTSSSAVRGQQRRCAPVHQANQAPLGWLCG